MATIIGIDPGFSGAIAILSDTLAVHDMPTVPAAKGRTELAHPSVLDLLRVDGEVWIERVNAMPGQGVSSSFRFGQGFGALEMACAANRLPIRYVTPSVWKKYFGLSKVKGASRSLAMQRFPGQAHLFQRVKDDGRAEAALIALYGREVA